MNVTQHNYTVYLVLLWRYIIFPYVTIPNVTIPRVVKIPNIYTNPERNNPARGGEKGTKLGEGERD